MTTERRFFERPMFSLALAIGLVSTTMGLVALGYRATQEWQHSAQLEVDRQTDLMLVLLASALNRDMKGAHVSVLLPTELSDLSADPPFDFRDKVARAFARFPYAEAFFAWRAEGRGGRGAGYAFDRVDRPSPWSDRGGGPDPVVTRRDPPGLLELVDAVRAQPARFSRFAVFEFRIGGARYQVVAQLFQGGAGRGEVAAVAGFVVNLDWIRKQYFPDLLNEVARLGGGDESVALMIRDENGAVVATTAQIAEGATLREWRFPVLFFDPAMRFSLASRLPAVPEWTVRVGGATTGPLLSVGRDARRTLLLLTLAASATIGGLLLTVRALRQSAELSAARSEFVSTVTHELKTPLALIRLVADTISLGRYTSTQTIADYARLLSQEAMRLSRLIDNLLTYARASDASHNYSLELLDPAELVDEALDRHRLRLSELGFVVEVAVPLDLPPVRADRVALTQVLDNLIDNVVKYSGEKRSLSIRGEPRGDSVLIEICDHGQGIPAGELDLVFTKFYRGHGARAEGSGLGLAIVRRIVTDHGGQVGIKSRAGEGTCVSLLLKGERA